MNFKIKFAKSSSSDENVKEPMSNPWALLPILVFICLYLGLTYCINVIPELSEYVSQAPVLPAFFIALIVAFLQNQKTPLKMKLKTIGKGVGNTSVVSMIFIFILAGIFAGSVGQESSSSVAFFILNYIPAQFSVIVIFIVSCLVSLAMGTSVGSITIMVPIAISVSSASGYDLALCVACAICGSMFGDNLSMISDTAIAACSGMECNPRDKFLANLKMVLPAAIITVIIIGAITITGGNGQHVSGDYNIVEFIPYIIVLILSILGINVFVVLGSGILTGVIVYLFIHPHQIAELVGNMAKGAQGMYELIIITVVVTALASLIRLNGGVTFVLKCLKRFCKSKKSAEIYTGFMVSIMDLIIANNTVAIVASIPIAKEVSVIYDISKRRMASILDTFSCIVQGLIPYGAQMIIAITLCNNSGFAIGASAIVPMCIYQYVLLVVVLFFLSTGLVDSSKSKKRDMYKL